jgi:oligoribonuclease NrnB/cAMP/cGMP phosphodiesterase (DHH superfamily)
VWQRTLKIVTHIDFDGICSAALFIRKYGEILDIIFATVQQAKQFSREKLVVDFTCDLPKVHTSINIDHHQTNFDELFSSNRLTSSDLVRPDAPSATDLVYQYLGFENDPIADQIRELGHLADTARLPSEYKPLDIVLNLNVENLSFLRTISNLLAQLGKGILNTEWLKLEHKKVVTTYDKTREIIKKFLERHPHLPQIVVIDTREIIPGKLAKEVFQPFFEHNATIIALIYKKSITAPTRVSFRVSKPKQAEYDVSTVATDLGGGGHRMAAACTPDPESIPQVIIAHLKKIKKASDTIEFYSLAELS